MPVTLADLPGDILEEIIACEEILNTNDIHDLRSTCRALYQKTHHWFGRTYLERRGVALQFTPANLAVLNDMAENWNLGLAGYLRELRISANWYVGRTGAGFKWARNEKGHLIEAEKIEKEVGKVREKDDANDSDHNNDVDDDVDFNYDDWQGEDEDEDDDENIDQVQEDPVERLETALRSPFFANIDSIAITTDYSEKGLQLDESFIDQIEAFILLLKAMAKLRWTLSAVDILLRGKPTECEHLDAQIDHSFLSTDEFRKTVWSGVKTLRVKTEMGCWMPEWLLRLLTDKDSSSSKLETLSLSLWSRTCYNSLTSKPTVPSSEILPLERYFATGSFPPMLSVLRLEWLPFTDQILENILSQLGGTTLRELYIKHAIMRGADNGNAPGDITSSSGVSTSTTSGWLPFIKSLPTRAPRLRCLELAHLFDAQCRIVAFPSLRVWIIKRTTRRDGGGSNFSYAIKCRDEVWAEVWSAGDALEVYQSHNRYRGGQLFVSGFSATGRDEIVNLLAGVRKSVRYFVQKPARGHHGTHGHMSFAWVMDSEDERGQDDDGDDDDITPDFQLFG